MNFMGKKVENNATDIKRIQFGDSEIHLVDIPMNQIGRPILGVTIKVRDLGKVIEIAQKEKITFEETSNGILFSPEITGNIFIEFR